jgi:hypothetical protein
MPHSPTNPIAIRKFDQSHRALPYRHVADRGPVAASRQVSIVEASNVPTVACITHSAQALGSGLKSEWVNG